MPCCKETQALEEAGHREHYWLSPQVPSMVCGSDVWSFMIRFRSGPLTGGVLCPLPECCPPEPCALTCPDTGGVHHDPLVPEHPWGSYCFSLDHKAGPCREMPCVCTLPGQAGPLALHPTRRTLEVMDMEPYINIVGRYAAQSSPGLSLTTCFSLVLPGCAMQG